MSKIDKNAMPQWNAAEDNKTFNRIIVAFLVATLIFTFIVSIVTLPEKTREEIEKIPPQLVKILEKKVEVVPPEPEPELPPEPVEEEVVEEEVEKEPEVKPEITEQEKQQNAKEKAKNSGLLALSDELSAMRETVDVDKLGETELMEGAGEAENTERVLLGGKATSTSGGVKSSSLSSDVGGGGELEGRDTTAFTAKVATEGGADEISEQTASEIASGNRTTESVRQVFDKNKGAIYSIYRRALRQDPGLEGKVVVSLVIMPNGSVKDVKIISSDIDYDDFASKLIARIKLINFGAMDVNEIETKYTFNFFPF